MENNMAINASSQKWKDQNSNYGTKVSAATVARLKKGTKASNIASANKPGASAELKEAVRRFYGKGSVGNTKFPTPNQTGPVTQTPRKPYIERGNPKPNPGQTTKPMTPRKPSLDRGNPKPTPSQLATAKRNKSSRQTKGPSLSTYNKETAAAASAKARAQATAKRNKAK
jgi:hypothetical protein